jgi:hypothetical protein
MRQAWWPSQPLHPLANVVVDRLWDAQCVPVAPRHVPGQVRGAGQERVRFLDHVRTGGGRAN